MSPLFPECYRGPRCPARSRRQSICRELLGDLGIHRRIFSGIAPVHSLEEAQSWSGLSAACQCSPLQRRSAHLAARCRRLSFSAPTRVRATRHNRFRVPRQRSFQSIICRFGCLIFREWETTLIWLSLPVRWFAWFFLPRTSLGQRSICNPSRSGFSMKNASRVSLVEGQGGNSSR
jgi:hypothetical protein